ncbi:MAG: LOG family protein [Candidatus Hinthialibacter antarcticus]|nr:LOG family protein [Candidatus Hinthialibacter antarcticus]
MTSPKTIAVYGSSAVLQDSDICAQAERIGYQLASVGFRVSNGGYMGVMAACSRGARNAGGEVIGVTCEMFKDRSPNTHLTEEISTKDLNERIVTLMNISDAYVILDGAIGTFAELFLAWNLVYMGWDKSIIVVGESMRRAVLALQEHTEIDERQMKYIEFSPDVDDAVKRLRARFGC